MLAEQPHSLVGLTQGKRSEMVISAITLGDGKEAIVSRLGDSSWDLRPYIHSPGSAEGDKVIEWPSDCPRDVIDDIKAVCYVWKHRGRNESIPPKWQTVRVTAIVAISFARWIASKGVSRISELRPIHLANYLHYCKEELALKKRGVRQRLEIIDLLWRFRSDTLSPLAFEPWDGNTTSAVAGVRWDGFASAQTPIIPKETQEAVYRHCLAIIEQEEASPTLLPSETFEALRAPTFVRIRTAAFYLVAITTGMRCDEVLGIKAGAYREESIGGVQYRWVHTIENKTGKGPVEYLCPEVTGKVLRVLERWAVPSRKLLLEEIAKLEQQRPCQERDLRLLKARADVDRLFLSVSNYNFWSIRVVSSHAAATLLREMGKRHFGWELTPHQARRTYARLVVESRMGRSSLIFLKWQLKHTSMTMTQSYGSNPIADRSLFEDFFNEMVTFKMEHLAKWTSDTPLSGGAGRSIMRLRATPHANRDVLLMSAAPHVHIRATGHGWCLADSPGCGGAGLYEATRCVNCKDGLIDSSFTDVWFEIHAQQTELLDLQDSGPAVKKRAEREVRLARKVLGDLGVQPLEDAPQ
jgi:integrase